MNPDGTLHMARRLFWSAFTGWQALREPSLPYWPPERLAALQSRRLRRIVHYAYDTFPYYRDLFDREHLRPEQIRCADDLRKLPIVEADALCHAPDSFVSQRYRAGSGAMLMSSGVSGNSKLVHWDTAALCRILASKHRYREVLARFVGKTFGYREMSVSNPENVAIALRAFYEANTWVPRSVDYERSRALSTSSFDEILEQIDAYRPDHLGGYGATLGALYRYAHEHGIPFYRPLLITYGASNLPEQDRVLLEERYNIPVVSSYQASEFLRIAYQCELRQSFHVCIDQVAFRVVDDDGVDVRPGEQGRIILTNLVNHGTVLLNYALGDLVILGEGPCACGRTLPTIRAIVGRAFDLLVLPGGQRTHMDGLIKGFAYRRHLVQWQMEQYTLYRYTVRVVPDSQVDWDTLATALALHLRQMIHPEAVIAIERLEYIPVGRSGKFKACISHLS